MNKVTHWATCPGMIPVHVFIISDILLLSYHNDIYFRCGINTTVVDSID